MGNQTGNRRANGRRHTLKAIRQHFGGRAIRGDGDMEGAILVVGALYGVLLLVAEDQAAHAAGAQTALASAAAHAASFAERRFLLQSTGSGSRGSCGATGHLRGGALHASRRRALENDGAPLGRSIEILVETAGTGEGGWFHDSAVSEIVTGGAGGERVGPGA